MFKKDEEDSSDLDRLNRQVGKVERGNMSKYQVSSTPIRSPVLSRKALNFPSSYMRIKFIGLCLLWHLKKLLGTKGICLQYSSDYNTPLGNYQERVLVILLEYAFIHSSFCSCSIFCLEHPSQACDS